MKIEFKSAIVGALVSSIITGGISLYIHFDEKKNNEEKTIEVLTKYFDSVKKDMSYNEALAAAYSDYEIAKKKIDDLEEGIINPVFINKAKEYANSKDYVSALLLLNNIKNKSTDVKSLIDEYTQIYENNIINQIEIYKNDGNIDEMNEILNIGLKNVPHSKILKNKQQEINELRFQNMTDVVPAYQSGGNEYKEYSANKDGSTESFMMGGVKYLNGMTFNADINIFNETSWAIYNLEGKYKNLNFIVCHVDNTDLGDSTTLQIFYDRSLKKEISLSPDMYPKKIKLNLTGVKQLKFQVKSSGGNGPLYGIGNPIIQ